MKGIIAGGDKQTIAAGEEILAQGGNAIDAAIAAVFASFVAEATMTSIGGGGIALIGDIRTNKAQVYDFFVDMPSTPPHPNMDFHPVTSDYGPAQDLLYIGRASSAVPGIVPGLAALAAEHGTLPLSALVAPAIRMAKNGVELSPSQEYVLDFLQPIFNDSEAVKKTFKKRDGTDWKAGEKNSFPALANDLTQIATNGPLSFTQGSVAQAIAADQTAHGGLITLDDLANYKVNILDPIRIPYRDFELLFPAMPSSGGGLIAFTLKLLESVNLGAMEHLGNDHIRALAEAMRLTNTARPVWDAVPSSEQARIERFLGDDHVRAYQEKLGQILAGAQPPSEPLFPKTPNNTTHISVVDAAGNFVGVTTTAGEFAGYLPAGTGIHMNNMLGEADLHPQGFHKTPPGTRLTTMMSPTVLLKDGAPQMVLGSGGSSRLRSAILQAVINVIDFGLPLEEAVHLPRIHFGAGTLQLEGGIPEERAVALENLGYQVNRWDGLNMYFGGTHVVALIDGEWTAVGDRRRGGAGAIVA
jgi:gamma-glutamyltranspeptidase/glutathione hydrolase